MVPGYRTGRLLGAGGSGEVWSAVREDGGEHVALKVVAGRADDGQALREGLVLRRVRHPHVVRLREVVPVPGVGTVLVLDRALGGSLAALVAARGPLDVGEVVTVLTPLAGALADLHERGLVHGDVSPGNVLFDELGRPLLSDLGTARIIGEGGGGRPYGTPGYTDPAATGGSPTPSSDVFALAAVAWLALTGRAPAPPSQRAPLVTVAPHVPADLALVLEEALDVDPDRRPHLRALAVRCFRAARAEPVRLVPTDPAAAPAEVVTHRIRAEAAAAGATGPTSGRRARHRGRPALTVPARVLALAVAAAAAVVTAAWLAVPLLDRAGAESAGEPRATVTARPGASPADVPPAVAAALEGDNPRAAVPALAWLRARGFSTGSAALLERANAPGGDALAADLQRLDALRETGAVLDGLAFDVRRTELVSRDGPVAVVDAAVVTSPHRHVDAEGSVVRSVPAGEERVSRLVLQRGGSGWQVVRLG